jgi:hypothetical protein
MEIQNEIPVGDVTAQVNRPCADATSRTVAVSHGAFRMRKLLSRSALLALSLATTSAFAMEDRLAIPSPEETEKRVVTRANSIFTQGILAPGDRQRLGADSTQSIDERGFVHVVVWPKNAQSAIDQLNKLANQEAKGAIFVAMEKFGDLDREKPPGFWFQDPQDRLEQLLNYRAQHSIIVVWTIQSVQGHLISYNEGKQAVNSKHAATDETQLKEKTSMAKEVWLDSSIAPTAVVRYLVPKTVMAILIKHKVNVPKEAIAIDDDVDFGFTKIRPGVPISLKVADKDQRKFKLRVPDYNAALEKQLNELTKAGNAVITHIVRLH